MQESDPCPAFKQVPMILYSQGLTLSTGRGEGGCGIAECLTLPCELSVWAGGLVEGGGPGVQVEHRRSQDKTVVNVCRHAKYSLANNRPNESPSDASHPTETSTILPCEVA